MPEASIGSSSVVYRDEGAGVLPIFQPFRMLSIRHLFAVQIGLLSQLAESNKVNTLIFVSRQTAKQNEY